MVLDITFKHACSGIIKKIYIITGVLFKLLLGGNIILVDTAHTPLY